MADKDYKPYDPDVSGLSEAERRFISMARNPEFASYLGRFADATINELLSVFGVAMAALRAPNEDGKTSRNQYFHSSHLTDEGLQARLERMTSLLESREEQIRQLQTKLDSKKRGGSH